MRLLLLYSGSVVLGLTIGILGTPTLIGILILVVYAVIGTTLATK